MCFTLAVKGRGETPHPPPPPIPARASFKKKPRPFLLLHLLLSGRLVAVLLESEVDGEPFSDAFFSASGSDPLSALAVSRRRARGGGLAHPPAINYSLSALPHFTSTIKKCALSLTHLY